MSPHDHERETTPTRESTRGVPRTMMVGYGVGDFTANPAFQIIALYYVFNLTDTVGVEHFRAGIITITRFPINAAIHKRMLEDIEPGKTGT